MWTSRKATVVIATFVILLKDRRFIFLEIYTEWKKKKSYISEKNTAKQKLAYAIRSSSGLNALLLLKETFDGKKTRGRTRTWTDDYYY